MPYELPSMISEGSVEQQLREIKAFLYRQAEALNYNLKQTSVESVWQKTAEALSVSFNDEVEEERRNEYRALRGLVIKSATSVIKNEDTFCAEYSGDYTAESPYGTLREEGKFYVDGNPFTINQLWKYQSEIIHETSIYKTELEGFINMGVLDRSGDKPVFGMDIGYNKNKYTVDGVSYSNSNPAKIRVTPVKISFFSGENEVAYLDREAIYFPDARITGGSININDAFIVNAQGVLSAVGGTFKGHVEASSGRIGGFYIADSQDADNGGFNYSISTVVRTDATKMDKDNPAYMVILRGQAADGSAGATNPTNVVFGIRKRTTEATWRRASTYTFQLKANGEMKIGSKFSVTEDGVLTATDGTFKGHIEASSGIFKGHIEASSGRIGGFCVAGNDKSENGVFNWSLSSVIRTDEKTISADKPAYAVILRGQNLDGTKGANSATSLVFGVKKAVGNPTNNWANESGVVSPVFQILANGSMLATEGTIAGFTIKGSDGGDFLPYSISTVHNPESGDVSATNPQYFSYMRSNVPFAYGSTVVFGSKYRYSTSKPWGSSSDAWFICADGSAMLSGLTIFSNFSLVNFKMDTDEFVISTGNNKTFSLKSGDDDSVACHKIIATTVSVNGFNYNHLFNGNVYMKNETFFGDSVKVNNSVSVQFYTTSAVNGENWLDMLFFGVLNSYGAFHVGNDGKKTRLHGTEVSLTSGAAVTSDERKKNDIDGFGEAHERMFGLLEPKTFRYNDGTSGRKHFGFIAQQVEASIEGAGLTTKDVAAFIRSELENDAGDELSLRYDEFIALNTHMIKKCLEEIARLKAEINNLKG